MTRSPIELFWTAKNQVRNGQVASPAPFLIRAVEVPKKRLIKRLLLQAPFKAPIHSKCCIRGFRETGLALVIVLRCD